VDDGDIWSKGSLLIRSAETPADSITAHIGIEPTRVNRVGAAASESRRSARSGNNAWCYESPAGYDETAETQALALLEVFEPVRDRIASLPSDCEVEVWLGLTAAGLGRLHVLDYGTVKRIADLGASLVIDFYSAEGTNE
jgi:hypothetical protein